MKGIFLLTLLVLFSAISFLIGGYLFANRKQTTLVAAVSPHHLVARTMIEEVYGQISQVPIKTIVIVSPDHFGQSYTSFLTTSATDFRGIQIDQVVVEQINRNLAGVEFSDSKVNLDHGVTVHTEFVKKYLPQTKVVPVLVSKSATPEQLEALAKILIQQDHIFVLASVDFSHFLNSDWAAIHDGTALSALTQLDYEQMPFLEVDCWQCLYVASRFSERLQAGQFAPIDHKNAADFIDASTAAAEVTSYVTGLFTSPVSSQSDSQSTILFTGNIDLSPAVAEKINQPTEDRFFIGTKRLLRGFDYVVGNLTIDTSTTSEPSVATQLLILKDLQFTHLSLRSNHGTINTTALTSIQADSQRLGIAVWGNGEDSKGKTYQDIPLVGGNLRLFSLDLNQTQPEQETSALKFLTDNLDQENANILYLNWDNKPSQEAELQFTDLAHQAIDVGIDGVIGNTFDASQQIDIYQGAPIFYSLGSFISHPESVTTSGNSLAVTAILKRDSIVDWRVFPLQLKASEPWPNLDTQIIESSLTNTAQTQFVKEQYSYTYHQTL